MRLLLLVINWDGQVGNYLGRWEVLRNRYWEVEAKWKAKLVEWDKNQS